MFTICKLSTNYIAINGNVEKALLYNIDDSNDEENKSSVEAEEYNNKTIFFLRQQRDMLKEICGENARKLRDVEQFVQAMGSIRDDIRTKQQIENPTDAIEKVENEHTFPDYRLIIDGKMAEIREQEKNNDVGEVSEYHKFSLEVRDRLGEKEKRKEDEDELEVIPTQNNDSERSLKCPITGMFYENPLRNKVCGHVYSKSGFQQMLRSKKAKCPVFGCNNKNVSQSQLEEDFEMEMRIRRYMSRIQREREASHLSNSDEDDDEEETPARMTVIE